MPICDDESVGGSRNRDQIPSPPLIAPRHRHVSLKLFSTRQFTDGVVQLQYEIQPPVRTKAGIE